MKNHRGVPTGIVSYVGPGNAIIKTKMSNDMINARQKFTKKTERKVELPYHTYTFMQEQNDLTFSFFALTFVEAL
jgi:hypothetical protein